MILNKNKVLVLAPHTDDEFACAGTIIKLVESKAIIHYATFSTCEDSVPQGYPKDILVKECYAATNEMGINRDNIHIYNFKVRYFLKHRQEILEELVLLNKKIQPNLVLLPNSKDIHQDHSCIYQEGFRAFKFSSILGYEQPQNTVNFSNTGYIKLDESHIEKKIKAMSKYKSQGFRSYFQKDFISGLAKVRGLQCNSGFAEAFEVIRLIAD